MAKKHERTLARRMVVQALYQSEITGVAIDQLANPTTELPEYGALPAYAVTVLDAVQQHRAEIDARISKASKNWALSRMPVVDRAILRCALCELLFIDDVPVKVCINEAVELAKEFGGEDESASFVNGVLGRIARSEESSAARTFEPGSSDQFSLEEAQVPASGVFEDENAIDGGQFTDAKEKE